MAVARPATAWLLLALVLAAAATEVAAAQRRPPPPRRKPPPPRKRPPPPRPRPPPPFPPPPAAVPTRPAVVKAVPDALGQILVTVDPPNRVSPAITNCSVYGKALGPFGAADIEEAVGFGVGGSGDLRIITLSNTSYTPGAQYQLFARVANALGWSNPSAPFEWTAPGTPPCIADPLWPSVYDALANRPYTFNRGFSFSPSARTWGDFSLNQNFQVVFNDKTPVFQKFNASNTRCVWWMRTVGIAQRWSGFRVVVPANVSHWPDMVVMSSNVAPLSFPNTADSGGDEGFWPAWFADPSTRMCGKLLGSQAKANSNRSIDIPCKDEQGNIDLASSSKYFVIFAVDAAGTKNVARWSSMYLMLGLSPPSPPPRPSPPPPSPPPPAPQPPPPQPPSPSPPPPFPPPPSPSPPPPSPPPPSPPPPSPSPPPPSPSPPPPPPPPPYWANKECSDNGLWTQVRAQYQAYNDAYTTATSLEWQIEFNNRTTNETLNFSPYEVAGLTYSPVDPMWDSGPVIGLPGNPDNRTCVWWFFPPSTFNKPSAAPKWYGVHATVPSSAAIYWPNMVFLTTAVEPPKFSYSNNSHYIWDGFFTNSTTKFCATLSPYRALDGKDSSTTREVYLRCRPNGGTGASVASSEKYLIGFAFDDCGSNYVWRWGALKTVAGP
ncbi:hypothetical protein ABPG77_001262 [Micractinium sp. CCAP 211/92]